MSKVIDFKKLGKLNLFERKGTVTIEVNGDTIHLPVKIKNLETSIMDIDVTPNKTKLKKIVKKFFQLEDKTRQMIENSDGFNPNEKGQNVIMWDLTDEDTSREIKRSALKAMVLEVIKEIDMDYESENEEGKVITLWELWNVPKNDYNTLSEVFMKLGVDEVLISQISMQIAKIKNGTMLETLEPVDDDGEKEEKSPSKRKSKSTKSE